MRDKAAPPFGFRLVSYRQKIQYNFELDTLPGGGSVLACEVVLQPADAGCTKIHDPVIAHLTFYELRLIEFASTKGAVFSADICRGASLFDDHFVAQNCNSKDNKNEEYRENCDGHSDHQSWILTRVDMDKRRKSAVEYLDNLDTSIDEYKLSAPIVKSKNILIHDSQR